MVKFFHLKKLNILLSIILIFKNILWIGFFFFQGKSIELAIKKGTLFKPLLLALCGYVLLKAFVMLCDIFQKYISEYYESIELKEQWNLNFPRKIYKDNEGNQNRLSLLFFDYLPRLFNLKSTIFSNSINIYCILFFSITALIYSRFYIAIPAIAIVFFCSYMSKNILLNQIKENQKNTNNNKSNNLKWINQYLYSYRETSKNWVNSNKEKWITDAYNPFFSSKRKLNLLILYRDLLTQALIELPFLVNSSIIIAAVYYEYISVTQLFIWVGFCQFMINASNAYFENRVHNKQCEVLDDQSSEILNMLKSTYIKLEENELHQKNITLEITLMDSSRSTLSLEPGIYRLFGKNGSGKSTLLNIILGYDRKNSWLSYGGLDNLINSLSPSNIRIIERETIIFESMDTFNSQIIGPYNSNCINWKNKVIHSTSQLLDSNLSKELINAFSNIEKEYYSRKDKSMSSGEKVIVSFIRFFASWDSNVRLLIIDECDSFLDPHNKKLFTAVIHSLSSYMAIYISTHDNNIFSMEKSSSSKITSYNPT
jgi:ABC-type lipoprotein export system ATPase subunit